MEHGAAQVIDQVCEFFTFGRAGAVYTLEQDVRMQEPFSGLLLLERRTAQQVSEIAQRLVTHAFVRIVGWNRLEQGVVNDRLLMKIVFLGFLVCGGPRREISQQLRQL